MLTSPRSRNYYASVAGVTFGNTPGDVAAEYCPHCLNSKTVDQVCATGTTQTYDNWLDVNGNPMPWLAQGVYTEGQEIIIEATLTTNHAGHFDLYACPDGNASTQQCFLDNPLTLVEDMLYGGPVDDHYPERAYVSPSTDFKFKYRLPMGVHGPQVMLQWRYVTANSCFPPGYVSSTTRIVDFIVRRSSFEKNVLSFFFYFKPNELQCSFISTLLQSTDFFFHFRIDQS